MKRLTVLGTIFFVGFLVISVPVEVIAKQDIERIQLYHVSFLDKGFHGFENLNYGDVIYTVPEGYRLIVETVSVSAHDAAGVNYSIVVRGNGGGSLTADTGTIVFMLTTKGAFPEPFSAHIKGIDAKTVAATLIVYPGKDLVFQPIRDDATFDAVATPSITVVGHIEPYTE